MRILEEAKQSKGEKERTMKKGQEVGKDGKKEERLREGSHGRGSRRKEENERYRKGGETVEVTGEGDKGWGRRGRDGAKG